MTIIQEEMVTPARILKDRFLCPNWMQWAACEGMAGSGVDFFATNNDEIMRAVATCNACAVQDLCGVYAIDEEIVDGVWGGMTEDQRKLVKKMLRRRGE